jgi:hypothetical protein
MCEKRRLRVQCSGEVIGGPVEAKVAKREAEGLIDLLENASRCGKGFGEILSHSRLLRALPGEKQNDIHH